MVDAAASPSDRHSRGARRAPIGRRRHDRAAGLTNIGVGLAIGVAGGVGALWFLQKTMYGVSAGDPLPVLLVIALIGASGYLACMMPTRRAAKGDPLRVLRE